MRKSFEERIAKLYDLNSYPEHLRDTVKIILEEGESLSDGVVYYATIGTVTAFAERIHKLYKGEYS